CTRGGLVEDAQVHCAGVQINPAVESVRLVVEAHHGLLWHGSGSLSPHRGWKATVLPENPTLGQKLRGFEPVYPWDRPRPNPSETMISIKAMQPTGHQGGYRAAPGARPGGPRLIARAFGFRAASSAILKIEKEVTAMRRLLFLPIGLFLLLVAPARTDEKQPGASADEDSIKVEVRGTLTVARKIDTSGKALEVYNTSTGVSLGIQFGVTWEVHLSKKDLV